MALLSTLAGFGKGEGKGREEEGGERGRSDPQAKVLAKTLAIGHQGFHSNDQSVSLFGDREQTEII